MNLRGYAQTCFFASGLGAALFFAGVELWAQAILALLLGSAALLEAWSNRGTLSRIPRPAFFLVGGLLSLLLLSLCPWPVGWAGWLGPAQAHLLAELRGATPKRLQGSMAPAATWHALFKLLGAWVVIYLTWSWSADREFRRRLFLFITLLGTGVALLAVADWVAGTDRIYGIRATMQAGHCGPFVNRNHFSNYMNLCAIFNLGMFLRHCFPGKNPKGDFRYGMISLFSAILCLSCSLATGSRGGLLSLGIGLAVFMLLTAFRRKFGLQTKALMLVALLGSVLLLTYGHAVLERLHLQKVNQNQLHLEEGRWHIWKDTRVMSLSTQGWGIGVGAFETVFPAFQTSLGNRTITHVENEYLQAWAEWGIAGSMIWVTVGLGILWRAWQTLKAHARNWQIAGWSALVVIAIHAGVDFPLHIPANTWLACALLGMCMSARGKKSAHSGEEAEVPSRPAHEKFGLVFLGCLLVASSIFVGTKSEDVFQRIEKDLACNRFVQASKESQEAIRDWPFYWRAHALAGYSAAGLPRMRREVERHFRNAQRLAQVDPRISMQAGLLFMSQSPGIASDFFKTSLALSILPDDDLSRIFEHASQNGLDVFKFAPLALKNPEQWRLFWNFLVSHKVEKPTLDRWLEEGARRWLDDSAQRNRILDVLIANGCGRRLLESFERRPPATDSDRYGLARAQESIGDFETAATAYLKLWQGHTDSIPQFLVSNEMDERSLREAMLKQGDLRLQRKAAESLAAHSRHADALIFWERLLQADPGDSLAKYGKALALKETGNWKLAAAAWRHLVEERMGLPISP